MLFKIHETVFFINNETPGKWMEMTTSPGLVFSAVWRVWTSKPSCNVTPCCWKDLAVWLCTSWELVFSKRVEVSKKLTPFFEGVWTLIYDIPVHRTCEDPEKHLEKRHSFGGAFFSTAISTLMIPSKQWFSNKINGIFDFEPIWTYWNEHILFEIHYVCILHTYHNEITYKKTFGGCNLARVWQNLAKSVLAPVISVSIQCQPFREKDSFEMWQLCVTR